MRHVSTLLLPVLTLCLIAPAAFKPFSGAAAPAATDWSQWRGPEGTGVSLETNVPTEWSVDKNIRWKIPIAGRGYSQPIVWGNRIFLTADVEGEVVPGAKAVAEHRIKGEVYVAPTTVGADRKHTFKVVCIDRDTGKVLWERTAYEGTVHDGRHNKKGSYAAPTPATDGNYVYVWFDGEGDGLYCYDFKGMLIWKSSVDKIAKLGMGPGTSPVLFENLVVLQCDEDEGKNSFIVALDKKTGREVWKNPRKVQVSWTTPLVVRAGARAELIANGNELIVSYDPKTGKELWTAKGHGNNAIPTPLAGHGMVFVYAGFPAKKTMAIKLGGSGDVTDTNVAWQYDKGTAYVPSSILYGDYIYLMSDKGILSCLDARTGKVVYEGGRIPVPATFTASPVAFGGKLLLTSEDGDTYVIKAGPKHEVITTNSIGEPVYASPAISNGMILIRGEKNLYCIGAGKAVDPKSADLSVATQRQQRYSYTVSDPMPQPQIFGAGVISTGDYDTHPAFAPDGKTLYFLKCTADIKTCTICVSQFKNNRWTEPTVTPFSGQYWDVDPFVTKDGKTVYYSSNRPLKEGASAKADTDIWKVEVTSSGWGSPVRLDSRSTAKATSTIRP